MLLLDTSVRIEVLRGRGGDLRARIAATGQPLAVTEPIVAEVLAGAHDPEALDARLAAVDLRSVDPGRDYRDADFERIAEVSPLRTLDLR